MRARALLGRAGLGSADADLAILRAKRSGGRDQLGFEEFVGMLFHLCERSVAGAGGRGTPRHGGDGQEGDPPARLRGALRSLLECMAGA